MGAIDHAAALGKGVVAFSTDASADFHRGEPLLPDRFLLTRDQRAVLDAGGVTGPVVFPRQVHGDVVWEAVAESSVDAGSREADAVVTDVKRLAVAIRTADCLPLLMVDPERRVVAAVHAGWKSTRLQIARRTVEVMQRRYGVRPESLRAVIGPCIRPSSYQVGVEFREHFPEDVAEKNGALHFDLAGANRRQLLAAGLLDVNVADVAIDTFIDRRWHSFRRDNENAGRMIHVIMLT